jgi:hypothetical protein
MSTFEDAARIALSLPGTEEVKSAFRVAGKNFAAVYPEKVHPKKPRVPNFDVLVTWVPDLHSKAAYLQNDPETFFTTEHYDDYPIVLVRLALIDEPELTELLNDAWASRAPRELLPDQPGSE